MSTSPKNLSGKGRPSVAVTPSEYSIELDALSSSGESRTSIVVTSPRDSAETAALSSSGESRTLDIPWEVDFGTVSDSWANQTEGEFDEILRRFENYNGSATGQVCTPIGVVEFSQFD